MKLVWECPAPVAAAGVASGPGSCWAFTGLADVGSLTGYAYVAVCAPGSSADACAGLSLGDPSISWKQVASLDGSEMLFGAALDGSMAAQSASGLVFGSGQVAVPFDIAQVDPATAGTYMSFGFFVVMMGWAAGFGIKKAVQFIRTI